MENKKKTIYSIWHQRILKLFFTIGIFGFISASIFRRFIGYPWYYSLIFYVSCVLSLITVVYIVILLQKDIVAPNKNFLTYSIFRRLLFATFFPFMIFLIYFVNLGYLYPLLYTDEFGDTEEKIIYMIKQKGVKNARFYNFTCDYYLKPNEGSHYFFQFCLNKDRFLSLPDTKFQVKLNIKDSKLGYVVKSIHFL